MKLTPWLTVPTAPHCAMRCIEGADPNDLASRIAFIEKTPRIRLRSHQYAVEEINARGGCLNGLWDAWLYGHGGAGGADGDDPLNQLYGHYPPSRVWCDSMLKLLGYDLD